MWNNSHHEKHYHHKSNEQNQSENYQKILIEKNGSATREVKVIKRVLNVNDTLASKLRDKFTKNNVFVANIMSSPGSGKTTTLQRTLEIIMKDMRCSVIVGDICTRNDADRIAESGANVVQINTDKFGGDCHLTASTVEKALNNIDLNKTDLLIVENIGNLVCPAEFDIGEDVKIVILSVTEGEDKPVKYPLMFRECNAALLNKIDLLPYLDFDKELAKNSLHSINPEMPIFEISAKTKEGFDIWIDWLKNMVNSKLLIK